MKNESFVLSTIALLIQSALCFNVTAAEHDVGAIGNEIEYAVLQPDPQRPGPVLTMRGSKITVKHYILPYWELTGQFKKLELITTGEGADANLLVNGSYGIRSFSSPRLGYTPELLVKSNHDIIFNNNFQSVDVEPYSGNIHLDAKGKIQFNLNVADVDGVLDIVTQKKIPTNGRALVRYYNNITPPMKMTKVAYPFIQKQAICLI